MKAPSLLSAFLVVLLSAGPAGAESFASWTLKAEKAKKRGDASEALEDYTSALRLWLKKDGAKAKSKVLAARAELLDEQGEADKALEDVESALAVDAKNARLYHQRGRLLMKQGRPTDAITDFYRATKLDIRLKDAYFDRAQAYELQGDSKFAKEDYKTACGLKHRMACDKIRPPKPKAKPKRSSVPGAAQRRRSKGGGLEVDKPAEKRRYKLDFAACIAKMDACVEEGSAFGDCADKALLCERVPDSGCCPELCVKQFHRLIEAHGRSEAAAFREVFAPKSPCSRGLSSAVPTGAAPEPAKP